MKKSINIFCLLLLSINIGCKGQSNSNKVMDFEDEKFQIGQIWQYETRSCEDQSRVIILRVEKANEEEVIVHISVLKLNIENPQVEDDTLTEIGHLPFSRESLANSLTNLESSNNKLPDYMDGYNQWKEAYNAGQGGIFTISVGGAVDFVEKTMNQ